MANKKNTPGTTIHHVTLFTQVNYISQKSHHLEQIMQKIHRLLS